jgi:lipoate-protein ligase B
LGLIGVDQAERIMTAARQHRVAGDIPDLLLFLAHPPTVAVGLRDRSADHPEDLLAPPARLEAEGIAFARSVRGGGITYHWPGQVVCYPVLFLRPWERDVPAYMNRLEEVGVRSLADLGVRVSRRRESAAHVGLWRDSCKVASMGVRIGDWVTSFGFAVNLAGDHEASAYIRPCGLEGVRLITVEEILGTAPPRERLIEAIKKNFSVVFGRVLADLPPHTDLTNKGGCNERH